MSKWNFKERVFRTIARYGGFYLVRLFWTITKHKQSRARAIILNEDKTKILLVQNITYTKYHLPGGGIESSESEEVAIKREIREELGIDITILYKLGSYTYPNLQNHVHIFVTQTHETLFTMQWELQEAQWFDIKNLPELKKTTKQALRDFLARKEPVRGTWEIDT